MKGISVKEAAAILGGSLINEKNADEEILGVVIDSRKVGKGAMFAALKGEHVDGHSYIAKAFELGAVCCLAEYAPEGVSGSVIVVPDVAQAMKDLAEAYRKRFDIPVIGIAGSVGKTTAKEMVAAVLSSKYNVLKTEKNLNNELGVPLTVFRMEPEHEAAVIEMGISDFGEMRRLAKIVRPTMAVYTLIGHAHLERLHDRNGVLRAKTEMVEFMPEDGTLFLNADDDLLASYECRQERVLYGLEPDADVRAENLSYEGLHGMSCDIVSGERRIHVNIPAYGKHMVYAALEGAAVGLKLGLSDNEIAAGIANYETVGRRASISDTGFITLVDDCYNANPDSVMCGIDSLSQSAGRKVCILGDMLEMGENREALHAQVGRYAADKGTALLLCVGELSRNTCKAAEGIDSLHFETNAELIKALPQLIRKGDTVLVKASHSMKFEEISEALKLLK